LISSGEIKSKNARRSATTHDKKGLKKDAGGGIELQHQAKTNLNCSKSRCISTFGKFGIM
jgi:hypothetical protein